ncbi:MAG: DUF4402 domain-containing protein [Pacificimonas sp.]
MNAVFKGALVAVTALSATAAFAADGDGQATVELVDNISITQSSTLDFGYVLQGTTGNVVLGTDGTVTDANNIYLNNASAGAWNLLAQDTKAVTITLPANGVVTVSDGTNTLAVNDFVRDGGALTGAGTAAGDEVAFNLGATLQVVDTAPLGVYAGDFTVTAEYQ